MVPSTLAQWYSALAASSLAQWFAAVGTISAVIVALLKDTFLQWWRKPDLIVTCENSHPWTVRTPIFQGESGKLLWTGDSYWVRVNVTNKGKTRAEKAQVSLSSLEYKPNVEGDFSEDSRQHFPLNLKWSHVGVPILDGISPGMSALCDIIAMSDPANPYWPRPAGTRAGDTVGRLQLEVELPPEFHSLKPGSWRLTLRIAAANAKPTVKTLLFSHTGQWRQNDAEMRRECLRVSLN
jgi:hypothetical protein